LVVIIFGGAYLVAGISGVIALCMRHRRTQGTYPVRKVASALETKTRDKH